MKRKVYSSDLTSIREYLVDIENKLEFRISTDEVIKRFNKRTNINHQSSYRSELVESSILPVVPKYSVINNTIENKDILCVLVPKTSIIMKLDYLDFKNGHCRFVFNIPSERIITEIDLERFRDDCIALEDHVENIVFNYIKAYVDNLFKGKIENDEKEWFLSCPKYNISMKKEVIF